MKITRLGQFISILIVALLAAFSLLACRATGTPNVLRAADWGALDRLASALAEGEDVNAADSAGNTPVMLAARRGHFETVRFLAERGANLNARNKNGLNALMLLANYEGELVSPLTVGGTQSLVRVGVPFSASHWDVAVYLIDHGVDTNAKDKAGATALFIATLLHKTFLAETLLGAGASPNTANDLGQTPLMVAASRGSSFFVRLLLSRGADVNAKDAAGRTALDVTRDGEIKSILLEHGAKAGSASDR